MISTALSVTTDARSRTHNTSTDRSNASTSRRYCARKRLAFGMEGGAEEEAEVRCAGAIAKVRRFRASAGRYLQQPIVQPFRNEAFALHLADHRLHQFD